MTLLKQCTNCHFRVAPTSDGTCPSCRQRTFRDSDSSETQIVDLSHSPLDKIEKIEVELSENEIHTFDSFVKLRIAILKGEISKSLRARIVTLKEGEKDEKWSTVEKIALANPYLRPLYQQPVWSYTLKYAGYGFVVGFCLKAIDTTVTLFYIHEIIGLAWLLILGSILLSKKWPLAPIAAIFVVVFLLKIQINLFVTFLVTMFVGFLFGAPSGMILGTIVGYFCAGKIVTAPDAAPEGKKTYVLGIAAPIIFLAMLIPAYIWFNIKIFEWLQA